MAFEVREEVKVFRNKLKCSNCEDGFMVVGNEARMVNPPQYVHNCTSCGNSEWVRGGKMYPFISYETVTPDPS